MSAASATSILCLCVYICRCSSSANATPNANPKPNPNPNPNPNPTPLTIIVGSHISNMRNAYMLHLCIRSIHRFEPQATVYLIDSLTPPSWQVLFQELKTVYGDGSRLPNGLQIIRTEKKRYETGAFELGLNALWKHNRNFTGRVLFIQHTTSLLRPVPDYNEMPCNISRYAEIGFNHWPPFKPYHDRFKDVLSNHTDMALKYFDKEGTPFMVLHSALLMDHTNAWKFRYLFNKMIELDIMPELKIAEEIFAEFQAYLGYGAHECCFMNGWAFKEFENDWKNLKGAMMLKMHGEFNGRWFDVEGGYDMHSDTGQR